ncbi:unnamed protein product [Fusarium venenatum]|uniref:Uncharacterized protein n=1 Tax=Fusarium venenatum TaxID=56646 RepID=A0A2L2TXL5_9HYPO|nr:uncharacterized protein FVRRES_03182 [Fusarium venenatum]CEI66670.1 unnamed protein product [Fusarium venenatum]
MDVSIKGSPALESPIQAVCQGTVGLFVGLDPTDTPTPTPPLTLTPYARYATQRYAMLRLGENHT